MTVYEKTIVKVIICMKLKKLNLMFGFYFIMKIIRFFFFSITIFVHRYQENDVKHIIQY